MEGGRGWSGPSPPPNPPPPPPRGAKKTLWGPRHCNQCGHKLDEDRATRDADGRAKLHADIAHPINSACREVVQTAILKAYQEERERSKQPGYVSSYDELEGDGGESYSHLIGELNASQRG